MTPVLLRRKLTMDASIGELARKIANISEGRILVIASVDFSHHVAEPFAILHDTQSVDTLKYGGFSDFDTLEVDCRNCLAVTKEVAHIRGKDDFNLTARTSVDTVTQSFSETENTSHIFGSFMPKSEEKSGSGVFLFAGNTHWTRGFTDFEKKNPNSRSLLTKILYQQYDISKDSSRFYHRLLSGFDDVVVSFDSVVATESECIQMWTEPSIFLWLHTLGITVANTANSHSHDCGKSAFEKMRNSFSSGGIASF